VIKHIPGRLNPADPGSSHPDYFPVEDDAADKRQMFVQTPKGATLCWGQSLDKDNDLEIREVVSSEVLSGEDEMDVDFFFCLPSAELVELLQKAYGDKPPEDRGPLELKKIGTLWWQQWRTFVPVKLRPRILRQFHNNPLAGHLGLLKTLDSLSCMVTWPGIRKDLVKYTKSCFLCQRAKHSTQKPRG
jgi:hypothetical protein